jgi:hypothetical protein
MPRTPLDHCQYFQPVQPPRRQMTLTIQTAKKRPFAIFSDLSRYQARVYIRLSVVMRGYFVPLAALLVAPSA